MKVAAILPGFVPSTYMSIILPLLSLQRQGKIRFSVYLENLPHSFNPARVDVCIFSRNVDARFAKDYHRVVAAGCPYIYDLDDNLFAVPAETELGKYYRRPQNLSQLQQYLENASLVRAYSPVLTEELREYNTNVVQVDPPIVWDEIHPSSRNQVSGVIKIVYSTSRIEDPLFQMILPAIRQILAEYRGRIELYLLGTDHQITPPDPAIHTWKMDWNYPRFMRRFSTAGFEIGLAPMESSPFYSSKTNNKFREYSACKIAGIYSNVPLYQDRVIQGKTGLFVENDAQSWYDAMKTLIQDHELRHKIQENAFEDVSARYSTEEFLKVWWEQILAVAAGRGKPGGRILKPTGPKVFHPSEGTVSRWTAIRQKSPAYLIRTLIRQLGNLLILIKINYFRSA